MSRRLDAFTDFCKVCSNMPFCFLPVEDQTLHITKLQKVVRQLKEKLSGNDLLQTRAGQSILSLHTLLQQVPVNELEIATRLKEIYVFFLENNEGIKIEKFDEWKKYLDIFFYRAFHHHEHSRIITETCSHLSQDAQQLHDINMVKDRIIFYVLEYTLQLQIELLKISSVHKQRKAIMHGIIVSAGNLPSLESLMRTFQDDVVYAFCNPLLRDQLLKIFLNFKQAMDTDDVPTIVSALSVYNIQLLHVVLDSGIKQFQGIVYKPYADGTLIRDIIKHLQI
ncbi:MAG: hypothetical protein COV59_05340 [Candidatus Magasanikbacteria bacterium CG11_big_fil_rev_8_21_14_0_20_39_34]|uniref:Uncharacterized protein n=1 Tax=Candidatus Magasanikbacteria bacterium CG11_big_fil_rev_8_21_14_0_20_39_34 TaxID=1974653 RepID=A0A2H0N3V9_9BACT|nr:MAG: hypothetical protein COV59_05340 [Candidatus Magasanikbacteria bacterium CG11_big_fil_rev_8_21_14_0_20_39_34]